MSASPVPSWPAVVGLVLVLCAFGASAVAGGDEAGAGRPAGKDQAEAVDDAAIAASIRQLELSLDDFPRLDCSTSAQPLLATVLAAVFDLPLSWQMLHDGSWRLLRGSPPSPDAASPSPETIERRRRIASSLAVSGTHDAYVNVIRGGRDLAVIARKPSEDEEKLMREQEVELDIQPVALDAFVFIVHPDNPVEGLTLEQVRDIFGGAITNWNQVGGPDRRINPYIRERNSGSQELMIDLVMKDRPFAEHAREDAVVIAMVGPMSAMARDHFGIGYTVHYYNRYMAPDLGRGWDMYGRDRPRAPAELEAAAAAKQADQAQRDGTQRARMLAIDGIAPGPATIADGSYPLIEPVYLVTRRDIEPDSPTARLRDWLLSPEGQAVIRRSLYVDRHGNAP